MVPNQSRAERTTSFDVAAFPLPTGREEEWRFTPVDRLGALLRTTRRTGAHLDWTHDAARGRHAVDDRVDEWRASGAPAPSDRAAAVAAAHSRRRRCCSTSPPTPSSTSRCASGSPAPSTRSCTATCSCGSAGSPRPPSCSSTPAPPSYSEVVSVVAGDGAQLTLVSVQEWDDDAHHLAQHDAASSAATPRCGTSP